VLGNQFLRCSTSVAANYRAACRGRSRAEFISKIGTVLEEADESVFWLELMIEAGTISGERVEPLLAEAKQLTAIFAATKITAQANAERKP
jgi:four helix bundle protein